MKRSVTVFKGWILHLWTYFLYTLHFVILYYFIEYSRFFSMKITKESLKTVLINIMLLFQIITSFSFLYLLLSICYFNKVSLRKQGFFSLQKLYFFFRNHLNFNNNLSETTNETIFYILMYVLKKICLLIFIS